MRIPIRKADLANSVEVEFLPFLTLDTLGKLVYLRQRRRPFSVIKVAHVQMGMLGAKTWVALNGAKHFVAIVGRFAENRTVYRMLRFTNGLCAIQERSAKIYYFKLISFHKVPDHFIIDPVTGKIKQRSVAKLGSVTKLICTASIYFSFLVCNPKVCFH